MGLGFRYLGFRVSVQYIGMRRSLKSTATGCAFGDGKTNFPTHACGCQSYGPFRQNL